MPTESRVTPRYAGTAGSTIACLPLVCHHVEGLPRLYGDLKSQCQSLFPHFTSYTTCSCVSAAAAAGDASSEQLVEVYLLVTHASIYPLLEGVRQQLAEQRCSPSQSSRQQRSNSRILSVLALRLCPVVLRVQDWGTGGEWIRGYRPGCCTIRSACPAPRATEGSG